jgi:DNA polymerase V
MSARVIEVLRQFSPELEIYSIDEAFLGMGGFGLRLEARARELRATVLRWTGIPVSVGIAPTKTLAKVANHLAKKDAAAAGVMLLLDEAVQDAALAKLELTDLWGIAGRLAARLALVGIATPLALKRADPRFVRERFSVVVERMVHELRGDPCLHLEEHTPDRKSIMASRSFGRPVTDLNEMREAVASHATRAAEKLRQQRLVTASLMVFVETNRFRPDERQHCATQAVRLPVASSDTARLIRAAEAGLAVLWRPGFRYAKAGVMLLDLHAPDTVQAGLFDKPNTPRRQALMRTIDALNRQHGRNTLSFATAGKQHGWKLRSDHLSPRFTTRWEDLLRV